MKIGQADGTYFRVHKPGWAFQPLSGAGAARQGGRLNRPGVHALYLSADAQTALAEYQQVSSLLPPGTIVSYDVALQPVVDFAGRLCIRSMGFVVGGFLLRLAQAGDRGARRTTNVGAVRSGAGRRCKGRLVSFGGAPWWSESR